MRPSSQPSNGTLADSVWPITQGVGVVAYVALVLGLVLASEATLHVFWDLIVPLLPLVLFVNPLLWRNVCPLATLNTVANGSVARHRVQGQRLRTAWYVGIALLFATITLRLGWLNYHGVALAALLTAFGIAALVLGAVYERRAGFCNSYCPQLPVERLYGQYPLFISDRVRCPTCSACASRGCLDLSPALAGLRAAGATREGTGTQWLRSAPGVFAVAFPGIIAGYYLADAVATGRPGMTVGLVLGGGVVSAGGLGLLIVWQRARPATTLPALALTAGLLYYWFASVTLAGWMPGVSPELAVAITRTLLITILAGWYVRAWASASREDLTDTGPRSPTSPREESYLPQGG